MKKYAFLIVSLVFGLTTIFCQVAPRIAGTIDAEVAVIRPTETVEALIPITGGTVEQEVCQVSHLTFTKLMDTGAGIYENNCRGCHGRDGQGTPDGFFPGLKGSGITQNDDPQMPIRYLMTTDIHPVASTLFEKDVASVMTFIRNAFGNEASVVCPEDVELRLYP